ncbi:MAG: radical SAM protein [bacterium]
MRNEIGSLYWVITHRCNNNCAHCYMDCGPQAPSLSEDDAVLVVENLPHRINHNIILSGGEVLHPENLKLLFLVCKLLIGRYGRRPIWLQTNGDFLSPKVIDDCLKQGIVHFSISSMDNYHKNPFHSLKEKEKHLRSLLKGKGLVEHPPPKNLSPKIAERAAIIQQSLLFTASDLAFKPNFSIWGANAELWLKGNWARGRALKNHIAVFDKSHNFCSMWSGGLNFLRTGSPRQEVVLQLSYLFPCCPSTKVILADTREEPLIKGLERAAREPVFRAINRGRPYNGAAHLGFPPSRARQRLKELNNICLLCNELLEHLDPNIFQPSPFKIYST